jgi:hypothetical protein
MDQRASEEYYAELLKRLHQPRRFADKFAFIPMLGAAGYFLFDSTAGGAFGALIGWGICAVLAGLDNLTREIWKVEYIRHLHEHTDEHEAGKRRFKIHDSVEKAVRRWWQI